AVPLEVARAVDHHLAGQGQVDAEVEVVGLAEGEWASVYGPGRDRARLRQLDRDVGGCPGAVVQAGQADRSDGDDTIALEDRALVERHRPVGGAGPEG